MLAPNESLKPIAGYLPPIEPVPSPEYTGFPFWLGMLVDANREQKSADWLEVNAGVFVYLPRFAKKTQCRGSSHRHRLHAVVPGVLFVPEETINIPRRREVFEHAHVHGWMRGTSGIPARLTKANIEVIREIEAKLNLPPEAKGVLFKLGQRVRFVNDLYADFIGIGTIFEIASPSRIGVEVNGLSGRIYVPASEIEAL